MASRATAAAEFMATPPQCEGQYCTMYNVQCEGQHDLLQDPWKGEGPHYTRHTSST